MKEEEKNQNFANSINKLSEQFNCLKQEFNSYKTNLLNICWPIGSYYWTNRDINPEKLFGGKWEKIEGKFLFAADNERKVDSTGGQEKVTLTINEMPSHYHEPDGGGNFAKYYSSYTCGQGDYSNCVHDDGYSSRTSSTGGNQPHENMPPYIAAFCWKRKE